MSLRVELAFSEQSSRRHVFLRNLLGVPDHLFPSTLVSESGTTRASPRSGSLLSRLAEQSPITNAVVSPSERQTHRRVFVYRLRSFCFLFLGFVVLGLHQILEHCQS